MPQLYSCVPLQQSLGRSLPIQSKTVFECPSSTVLTSSTQCTRGTLLLIYASCPVSLLSHIPGRVIAEHLSSLDHLFVHRHQPHSTSESFVQTISTSQHVDEFTSEPKLWFLVSRTAGELGGLIDRTVPILRS